MLLTIIECYYEDIIDEYNIRSSHVLMHVVTSILLALKHNS